MVEMFRAFFRLLFIAILTSEVIHHGVTASRNLNHEEGMELGHQSRTLSKPAVKTIEDKSGDIFDCVDINNQPTFDHPLLKNHTIQKEPTSYPYNRDHKELSTSSFHSHLPDIECPTGTVPMRRMQRETYSKFIPFSKFNSSYSQDIELQDNETRVVYYYAMRETILGTFYGGRASLSVNGLEQQVFPDELSGAALWVVDDSQTFYTFNFISAGWMVSHELYGDDHTRLTISWQVGSNHHCTNLQCPGFVQTSSVVALGSRFKAVSIYLGPQYHCTFTIFKDRKTGNWWLLYGDDLKPVGYWPKELFTSLTQSAAAVQTGGFATGHVGESGADMGNGHRPHEGWKGAAYVRKIYTIDKDNHFLKPTQWFNRSVANRPYCYEVGDLIDTEDPEIGLHFYYGGPGNNCRG